MSVLLDTSYLISLVSSTRPHHSVARSYYRLMLEQSHAMHLSSIVVSEFEIKQRIKELPLRNFRMVPFNVPHAIKAAQIWNSFQRDSGDSRVCVKDDVKLIAQAAHEEILFILTEDASTLYKYTERLRSSGVINVRAIKLEDGFDSSAFRPDGQRGLI